VSKILLDKYYTGQELANYCTQKAVEIIGIENITEFIESSAGSGVFLNSIEKYTPNIPYKAYDIEPEDNRITKQDYLTLDLEYKQGRCVIGNPPFGRANSMLKKFYKHSHLISDYIVFILPISQLNNNNELYQFNLIYSEDLGIHNYTNKELHCCLNIYKKPLQHKSKPNNKLKDIKFIGWRNCNKIKSDFKLICYGARTGDIIYEDEIYANSLGFIINNKNIKEKVINVLLDNKFRAKYNNISTPNLTQWQVYKYLKEQIPGLE